MEKPDGAHETIDLTFWCDVPAALGAVTKFATTSSKRLVAETESGIPFIIPVRQRSAE